MKTPICLAVLMAGLSAAASAATVSLNFTGNAGAAGTLASTDVAGVVAVSNWNNVSASNAALVDSTGASSAIRATYSIGGWSNKFVTGASANEKLMKGYLDIGGSTATVSLVNLDPATTYQVYVYSDGENSFDDAPVTRTGSFTLNGATTGITDAAGANFTSTFTGVTSGSTGAGNYTVFTITGSSSYTLSAFGSVPSPEDNVARAPINGIQIVSIPEASTSLVAAGLGLLALARRRRNA